MKDLWLAAWYAVIMGVVALAVSLATGLLWVAGAGGPLFGLGVILLAAIWPRGWCLVLQFRGGRVRHWHRPKSEIVDCRQSVGFHVGRRRG